jgi:hypothetical protein
MKSTDTAYSMAILLTQIAMLLTDAADELFRLSNLDDDQYSPELRIAPQE